MKHIVITGANRGIGLELAKKFSESNKVTVLCRSEFPADALNDNIDVVHLDVTDEQAIIDFAKKLDEDSVAIDLLINNAGMAGGDLEEEPMLDADSLNKLFSVNAVGPMLMNMHLAPVLNRAENPVMIAISSRMGTHAALNRYNAEWWPYSASKAALSMEVSAFAINEPRIKSISVHPGWVKTDMGGEDADITTAESADGIKKLYESIDTLQTGSMYNYDGTLMNW